MIATGKELEKVPNQLGKRYVCEACGTQVLCTKSGEGAAACCGQDMVIQEPKAMPSSD